MKRLLTHNDLSMITSGNCVPLDSCRVLTISSKIERQEQHLDMDANDGFVMKDISCMIRLSQYVESTVVYIAGYVVKAVMDKIVCDPCRSALIDGFNMEVLSDYSLIVRKNRGGLITPSRDVITICKVSESVFRRNTGQDQRPPNQINVQHKLVNSILLDLVGEDIFSCLVDHSMDTEILKNHRVLLIKKIAYQYLTVRLHHQGRVFTRHCQGESVRSALCKTVHFKGQ